QFGYAVELLHGVVRRTNDAGAEKQPADAITTVEIQRQRHHLFRGKAGARHIAGAAVDAVLAVVQAEGQQDLQQRYAAAIGREAVADAHAVGGAKPTATFGTALRRTAAGA